MNEKDAMGIINTLSDDVFIKVIRKSKNKIQKIEKKEKLAAIDQKFREKGVECPKCQSFWCVKNGFKNDKQKYLCKNCKSSFDGLRNHFLHWSHLSHEQWDWIIQLSLLRQSAYIISQFAKISKAAAWFNHQKFMKSPQLAKAQQQFKKLGGKQKRIEIDMKRLSRKFIRVILKILMIQGKNDLKKMLNISNVALKWPLMKRIIFMQKSQIPKDYKKNESKKI